jgi:hypothetical protein
MDSEPAYVQATLEWCNFQRAAQGLKPLDRLPKGKISDPRSCPCGAATGLEVSLTFYITREGYDRDLPKDVQLFVLAFDRGKLPQYRG